MRSALEVVDARDALDPAKLPPVTTKVNSGGRSAARIALVPRGGR